MERVLELLRRPSLCAFERSIVRIGVWNESQDSWGAPLAELERAFDAAARRLASWFSK